MSRQCEVPRTLQQCKRVGGVVCIVNIIVKIDIFEAICQKTFKLRSVDFVHLLAFLWEACCFVMIRNSLDMERTRDGGEEGVVPIISKEPGT